MMTFKQQYFKMSSAVADYTGNHWITLLPAQET